MYGQPMKQNETVSLWFVIQISAFVVLIHCTGLLSLAKYLFNPFLECSFVTWYGPG